MQSKWMSWVEVSALTLVTGAICAVENYYLLPILWHLPPTPADSITMAIFYGGQSILLKYPIRRFFNAFKETP